MYIAHFSLRILYRLIADITGSFFLRQHKKHMVTASYVDDSMSKLDEVAKSAGVTILCEMGLDPGIGSSCLYLLCFFDYISSSQVALIHRRRYLNIDKNIFY